MESDGDLTKYYGYSNIFIIRLWLARVTGLISLISSMWILFDVRKKKNSNISIRIITLMSISDAFSSFFLHILGSTMIPKGLAWGAIGNKYTCTSQGFIGVIFGFSCPIYNVVFAIYVLLAVKYKWKNRRFDTPCCRFWMLFFPLAFSTIFSILILVDDAFNFEGSYICWVNPYPNYCSKHPDIVGECTQGKKAKYFEIFGTFFYGITSASICISMILLVRYTKDIEKKPAQHAFDGMATNITEKSNKVARVGVLFSVSYMITYIFSFIGFGYGIITGNDWPVFIKIMHSIFGPMQGFFNALVYIYRKDAQNMRYYIQHVFQRCRFSKKNTEERRNSVRAKDSSLDAEKMDI